MTDTGSGQMELTVKAEYELGTQARRRRGVPGQHRRLCGLGLKIEILSQAAHPPEQCVRGGGPR